MALVVGGALLACMATSTPPASEPRAADAIQVVASTPTSATCFAPPPPAYLPWGRSGSIQRITGERGVEYVRYTSSTSMSTSPYFAIARAPADRLSPPVAVPARNVSGRQVLIFRVGDPGVVEVAAQWQEGMDGCTYDAHLFFPAAGARDEDELAKVVASLDIWAGVRAQLPPNVAVLKPTTLPARFTDSPWLLSVSTASTGPRYSVAYRANGEALVFYLGPANSAAPISTESVTIRGANGTLSPTASSPAIQAAWVESGQTYVIQDGSVMTRDELVRITAALVDVR